MKFLPLPHKRQKPNPKFPTLLLPVLLLLGSAFEAKSQSEQTGWRWCKKCQVLFFTDNPTNGKCFAGGQHDDTESGRYRIDHNLEDCTGSPYWAWCSKCETMSFRGRQKPNECPRGGWHEVENSGIYCLYKSENFPSSDLETQGKWLKCNRCKALFLTGNGTNGICIGGEEHSPEGSDYTLKFEKGSNAPISKPIFDKVPDASRIEDLCPSNWVNGDREFGGNGPEIYVSVKFRHDPENYRTLLAQVTFSAKEAGGDYSEVTGSWNVPVYYEPTGCRKVSGVKGTDFEEYRTVLQGGGRNEMFQGCDGDIHELRVDGPIIKRLFVVGDTGGLDISNDDNCHCDTRIVQIEFQPFVVVLNRFHCD